MLYLILSMARLFGIIASHPINFNFSINPSTTLTGKKIHGWGMGWYDDANQPQIKKEKRSALINEQQKIGTTVTSRMILVHQRIATSGTVSDENAHPFIFKNYIFAHIGTINKEKILALLTKPYGEKFQSEPIDSEAYFRFIIQNIETKKSEAAGIADAVKLANDERGANFILLSSNKLYAYCYGLPFYFLRWRKEEPLNVRSKETDAVFQSDMLKREHAMIISSEKLTGDNWMGMDNGELLTIYSDLTYEVKKLI